MILKIIKYIIICLGSISLSHSGRIDIQSATEIRNTSMMAYQLHSYKVGIISEAGDVLSLFDNKDRDMLEKGIKRHNKNNKLKSWPTDEIRGIPASNWVKFNDFEGRENALFIYKTIHRCNHLSPRLESWLYDSIDINKFNPMDATTTMTTTTRKFSKKGDINFITRSSIGRKVSIHTVTTELAEAYLVNKANNMTIHYRTESDIRITQIPKTCQHSVQLKISGDSIPHYIFTGSYLEYGTNWKEYQFLSIVDSQFMPLASWTLLGYEPHEAKKKQKNWVPFWDESTCKLYISKKYAPSHDVGEITEWNLPTGGKMKIKSVLSSSSPASVPSETFVRGGAPPIFHPKLKPGLALGCIHVKGKHKVYRHALYIMETKPPFKILSFSSLFTFHPLRNIEFVMSLHVTSDGRLQLTHGSSDCEPRLSVFPLQRLKDEFGEYLVE